MARRSIWTGSITFGLVNIPIKLYPAVSEDRVSFHLLHDQDKVRLRRKLVCPADGKEVHPEHMVRGYELAPDQYVVVHKEEIESCSPEKSKTIEISDFVDLADIDPIYYDRPYYVMPQAQAGRSYKLLVEAMKRSKKVGIAKVVLHEKGHLAALRPVGDVILLETMHFGNEVVPVDEVGEAPAQAKVNERELKVAQQLVDSLAGPFKPDKYRDEYKDCIMELVEKKAKGEKIVTQPPPQKRHAKAADLMAALEASLAQAKGQTKRKKSA